MRRVAVIGAILEDPIHSNSKFNEAIAEYKHIVRGRMGIPFDAEDISVVSITVIGTMDEINSLTGKLGNIHGVSVKTSVSKKEV